MPAVTHDDWERARYELTADYAAARGLDVPDVQWQPGDARIVDWLAAETARCTPEEIAARQVAWAEMVAGDMAEAPEPEPLFSYGDLSPPDYLAEDAARQRFDIEHAAWMEEHGEEYERVMAELEAEHLASLPEPEGPDMDTLDIG